MQKAWCSVTVKKDKQFSLKRSTGHKKFSITGESNQDGNQQRKILYDATWSRYRLIFLKVNPICYSCGERSEVVDHIVAHKNDEQLFKSTTNHLPLCKKCHNNITNLFDRYVPPKTQEKIEWINDYRRIRGVAIQVKVLPKYGRG